ncbi:MAG: cytochrome b/b6 domain-containing protein [Magnetospiraceae bacterium]
MKRIYIFKAFERFWHWAQALLIIGMLITGFEIHGTYALLGWETAITIHTTAAWALITLWVFAIFWHFTSGEWKQYIPDTQLNMTLAVARYYAIGIFTGDPHPYKIRPDRKHNPMQRNAYLGVKLFINPVIWISGLLYLFYAEWSGTGLAAFLSLEWVAIAHTFGAFLMLMFLIAHLYLITTGGTVTEQLKAMITGWEEVEE